MAGAGARSPSFTPLPRDKSIHFAEYVDWHMQRSPQHPFARLVSSDSNTTVEITMNHFGSAVHTLARHFLRTIPQPDGSVVAITLSTHPLLYITVIAALLRAGFQAFPIAVTMPDVALKHLLRSANAQHIVCSEEIINPVIRDLVELGSITTLNPLSLVELYPALSDTGGNRPEQNVATPLQPLDQISTWTRSYSFDNLPTLILHTSGSTNLPKPIPFREKALAAWLQCPFALDIDFCGLVVPSGFLPPHHISGLSALFLIPMVSGLVVAMDHPSSPASPVTPSGIIDYFKRVNADLALVPPVLCNFWSNDPDAIKYLSTLKLIAVGTAALDTSIGNKLVAGGVRIMSSYGSTEGGQIWQLVTPETKEDWNFGKFYPYIEYRLIPVGVNRYRLELLENDFYTPAAFNSEDGTFFNSHDILERHSTKHHLYRVVERDDNQMVLVTGETVLVAQLENVVRQCSNVKQVSVFGHGRSQLGIMVEPRDDAHRIEPGLRDLLAELKSYVIRANSSVPAYSQVPTDLIIVLPPGTSIPISAKGTVPRPLAAKLFADLIDNAYEAAAQSRSTFAVPDQWTESNVLVFVKTIVQTIVCSLVNDWTLDEDVDLFLQGCNSIHSAYIHGALVRALESRGWQRSSVPSNVVYQNPTIRQLALFVFSGNSQIRSSTTHITTTDRMVELVQQSLSGLATRNTQHDTHDMQNSVLLTGSTGALGCFILRELLLDASVTRVYALVRQSDGLERQTAALIDRGINPDDLPMGKLEILHGDACLTKFGLNDETWRNLIGSISTVVHCAWRLDFNLNLISFRPYIDAVQNIINLAAASTRATPPHIVFTSSIDTIHGWTEDRLVPDELVDPKYAVQSGYGESKWVADKILSEAASSIGIQATSLRISQLCGSTLSGCWNVSDWVPQIVRASAAIGRVPTKQDGVITWLPIDIAARAVLAAARAPSKGFRVLNIENPSTVPWQTVFSWLKDATERHTKKQLTDVAVSEWISAALEHAGGSISTPEQNATLHIAQFLRNGWGERWTNATVNSSHRDAVGIARLDTTSMRGLFPELAVAPITKDDVDKWVQYWAKHGLFS